MKLLLILLLIVSCGDDHVIREYVPVEKENPGTPTNPNPGQLSYGEMQALMNNYCQACHSTAGFMQSESALRSSDVKARLWSRNMPPSNANLPLPDTERQKMIEFF